MKLSSDVNDMGGPWDDAPHPWFALRVRSNFERVSVLHLRQRGFEEFLPTYGVESRWSDRTKQADRPLFPGYIFCRLNPHDRLHVLSTPGIVGIVGFGRTPVPVSEHEIEAVRTVVKSGLRFAPWPFLRVGQNVLIESGPLAGVEGILTEFRRGFRLVVSVSLLQRSVAAELDGACVRPVRSVMGNVAPPPVSSKSAELFERTHSS